METTIIKNKLLTLLIFYNFSSTEISTQQ